MRKGTEGKSLLELLQNLPETGDLQPSGRACRCTMRLIYAGVFGESPPAVVLIADGRMLNGVRRVSSMAVRVEDPGLFDRLRAEVRKGEKILVTTVADPGRRRFPMLLESFERLEEEATEVGRPTRTWSDVGRLGTEEDLKREPRCLVYTIGLPGIGTKGQGRNAGRRGKKGRS